MKLDSNNLEAVMFDLIDQVKVLISQDTWGNILLNCSKNELLVLMLLYRESDVNMTQIADYLNAPLNTTTGIVSRMEKKDMVERVRSESDKRVVTIVLTAFGKKQISEIIGIFLEYGQKLMTSLTPDELALMSRVIGKIIDIVRESTAPEQTPEKKIRKIMIE